MKLALIGAGVVALVAACVFGSLRCNSRPTGGYDAQVACRGFVKDRLKVPLTADFSRVTHSGAAPAWTVTGAVDAENSFGARLLWHLRRSSTHWTLLEDLKHGDYLTTSAA